MKIVVLTQYYPPEIGAPQARLSQLAAHFAARGHEVLVLTAMPNYPQGRVYPGYRGFFRQERRDGIRLLRSWIYPSQSVGLVRRMASYFSFVGSSLAAGLAMLPRADYLLTESPPLFLGISGFLLSRMKRARWIFNVSDLWPESAVQLGIIGEGLPLRLARDLEALCYRKAWLVTGQSKEILSNIRQRFPNVRTYHLSNGVDTNLFSPERRAGDARRQLLGDEPGCVAIYAGLHGIAQGLEQIVQAAALLQDRRDLKFVLMGDGPEKKRLKEQAQALGLANLRFLDPCPREAMPALMASADIALVPLKQQLTGAVPSKLYEAMGSGLPTVFVADGEGAQIVHETGAGIVVQPGDITALAAAIGDLASDTARRAALAERGRQAALAHYDRNWIADKFITMLEAEHLCSSAPSLAHDQTS